MLHEVKNTRQEPGEPFRKCFSDDYFDLIIWYKVGNHIDGFQLCYDKPLNEHALTWERKKGFFHNKVDTQEEFPHKNRTPILVSDGNFLVKKVMDKFVQNADHLEEATLNFIIQKMESLK